MCTKTKKRIITVVVTIMLLIIGLLIASYVISDLNTSKTEEVDTPIVSIEEPKEIEPVLVDEPIIEEPEPEPEPELKSVYVYTEEELDLLSRLIYSEGGIESYDTQLKIGSVVMNRVDDPAFPNTIREVIYQRNQFSVTFIKKDGIPMIDHPADEEAKQAALEVLTYGSVLPPKVQVFYEKSITKGWVASRQPYGTFDSTTFAYIYSKGENR